MTFGPGQTAPIGGASGTLYFVGIEGCGHADLARKAAGRLGLTYVDACDAGSLAAALSGRELSVAVTAADLLADPATVEALRASGKVFYLMSVAPVLAKNLGDLSRLEELALRVERMEPVFFSAAHFIMPVATSQEEMLDDVVEKAAL